MKLLDYAEVEMIGDGQGWVSGWEGDSRNCGVDVALLDAVCDVENPGRVLLGDEATGPTTYRVMPFGAIVSLRRNTSCIRPDDEQWLADTLKEASDLIVTRGLVTQQHPDNDAWVGSDSAYQVTGTFNPTAPDAAVALALEAHFEWTRQVLGSPVLHASGAAAVTLNKGGFLVQTGNGELETVFGEPVIVSEGYNANWPGYTPASPFFFTGPIKVRLSAVDKEELLVQARSNKAITQASIMVAIDIAPCSIVRVGAASVATP